MNKNILTVTLNPCIDKTIEVENFTVGGLNRTKSIRTDAGGKGINVSKALKNFGADTIACGIIGGNQGKYLLSFLKEQEIPYVFTETEDETRTNYKIYDSKSHITTEINEQDFFVHENTLRKCIDSIKLQLQKTEIMVLSGSIPKGVNNDIYQTLIEIAKSYNVKVILDADGEKLKKGIEAAPYAIKPNLFELEQFWGKAFKNESEIVEAAKELINAGIKLVIVSMGGDGAMFINENEAYKATPFAINCKSTVGAGDSMVAALAYCMQQNFDIIKLIKMSTAAGTVTASKEGTNVCTLDEVTENISRVKVEKVEI